MIFTADYAIRAALGRLQPFEQDRLRHGLGWWAPEMRAHWSRLWTAITSKPGDILHAALNIPVEWTRADPSRAVKLAVIDQGIAWALVVALVWHM